MHPPIHFSLCEVLHAWLPDHGEARKIMQLVFKSLTRGDDYHNKNLSVLKGKEDWDDKKEYKAQREADKKLKSMQSLEVKYLLL